MRPVLIRPNYFADTNFLLRLAHAIELDREQPDTWRREVIIKINELVVLLSEANLRKVEKEKSFTKDQ